MTVTPPRASTLAVLVVVATATHAQSQEGVLRGHVEARIGVVDGEWEYLFENIESLTRDAAGRIYVGDSGTQEVRVFSTGGEYLFSVGRPGEGPGEFHASQICGLSFDREGRLWVNSRDAYKVFNIQGDAAEYSQAVFPPANSTMCVNPMFAGPTGLTLAVLIAGKAPEHVRMEPNGTVHSRVPITAFQGKAALKWPLMKWRHHDGSMRTAPIEPPFAVRSLVAHAPDGAFAHVITREYRVTIFDADGHEIREIRRDLRGPEVTPGEARRENERLERMRQNFASLDPDFPSWEMPERKPPIYNMWYDEQGRLWVHLWPGESDEVQRAHVYDGNGAPLFTAEWPCRINISLGGVKGDIALGVERLEFDVQRVVVIKFDEQ